MSGPATWASPPERGALCRTPEGWPARYVDLGVCACVTQRDGRLLLRPALPPAGPEFDARLPDEEGLRAAERALWLSVSPAGPDLVTEVAAGFLEIVHGFARVEAGLRRLRDAVPLASPREDGS